MNAHDEIVAGTTFADREPVRLPIWAATFAGAAITFGVAVLQGAAWRPTLAGVLGGLAPILTGTEIARQRSYSPLSVLDAAQTARDDAGAPPIVLGYNNGSNVAPAASDPVPWDPPSYVVPTDPGATAPPV